MPNHFYIGCDTEGKVSKEDPEGFTTMVQNDPLHLISHMKDLWESTAKR